ncbi:unnamed protein product, partial [Mycena citricolor]
GLAYSHRPCLVLRPSVTSMAPYNDGYYYEEEEGEEEGDEDELLLDNDFQEVGGRPYEDWAQLRDDSRVGSDNGGSSGEDGEQQPEREASKHNMGLGVCSDLIFIRQVREKRRKNAKSTMETKLSFYFHEASCLSELLEGAFATAQCTDEFKYKVVASKLRTTAFTVTMTVPGTTLKAVPLLSQSNLEKCIAGMEEKGKSNVKMSIAESAVMEAPNENNVPAQQDEEGPVKKRKRQLSPEEEALGMAMAEIQVANRCNDRRCPNRICFTKNGICKHVLVTPLLLRIWGSAIVSKMDGVTPENPPPHEVEKAFWPLGPEPGISDTPNDDISLMASRRLNSAANKSSPSVTINNDFAAFASLLQPLVSNGQTPNASRVSPALASPALIRPISPAKPKRMTFDAFCKAFRLPPAIFEGLRDIGIDGPHIIAHLTNTDLDRYLPLGLRAQLRYAQSEWEKGKLSADG